MNDTMKWVLGIVIGVGVILLLLFALGIFDDDSDLNDRDAERAAEEFQQQAEEFEETASQASARLEARSELAALEAQVAAEQGYDEVADDVADIRANLKTAYANARGSVRAEWQDIDADLEALETNLREESADALSGLQNLVARLKLDIRTDEE